MKITRSSKTSLKFATAEKLKILNEILDEYARAANFFIAYFWEHPEIRVKDEIKKINIQSAGNVVHGENETVRRKRGAPI